MIATRNEAGTRRKFDDWRFEFLLINSGRAASRALSVFLGMHPGAIVVPRLMLDKAIEKRAMEKLRTQCAKMSDAAGGKAVGLVEHAVRPLVYRGEGRRHTQWFRCAALVC